MKILIEKKDQGQVRLFREQSGPPRMKGVIGKLVTNEAGIRVEVPVPGTPGKSYYILNPGDYIRKREID